MARQSVSDAVTRIRDVMWALTHQRRWNPSNQYRGSRVTVHGATRHTSSALLLFNKDKPSMQRPTETTILEVQQRADARTWRKHYCHAHDDEVKEALEFGSAPSPFKRSKKEEKTEKTSKEKSQHGGLTPVLSQDQPQARKLDLLGRVASKTKKASASQSNMHSGAVMLLSSTRIY